MHRTDHNQTQWHPSVSCPVVHEDIDTVQALPTSQHVRQPAYNTMQYISTVISHLSSVHLIYCHFLTILTVKLCLNYQFSYKITKK